MNAEAMALRCRRILMALLALICASSLTAGADETRHLTLAVAGLTQGYLEPCGCGGQDAGGLARRAALLDELRQEHPNLVALDVGGVGQETDRWPVILRSLARMGTAGLTCSAEDLGQLKALGPQAQLHALPIFSLGLEPPATSALSLDTVGSVRVGIIGIAFGQLPLKQLLELAEQEVTRLRATDSCDLVALISHLGQHTTGQLVRRLGEGNRPDLIFLATTDNEPQQPVFDAGLWWIPVAQRGRSLSVVKVELVPGRLNIDVDQRLVATTGEQDPQVRQWIDEYYGRTRMMEAQVADRTPEHPEAASCQPCHSEAVAAWRRHAHSRALQTLTERRRDVAECLRCHDQTFVRTGRRPSAEADQGIQCVTCHDGLPEHVRDQASRPTSLGKDGCEQCHMKENSPSWDWERYRAEVLAVCGGG